MTAVGFRGKDNPKPSFGTNGFSVLFWAFPASELRGLFEANLGRSILACFEGKSRRWKIRDLYRKNS